MSEEKWPAQKRVTPVGYPPKGMWYSPEVKESAAKGISLNDAVKFFLSHPDLVGRPGYISVADRTVEFDNGKVISFEELMDLYLKHQTKKGSEGGFFDSPGDLGKDPKGDFPSITWLPRGQEDQDVDPNITTADLGLSKLDKKAFEDQLTLGQKEAIAAKWGVEMITALNHFNDAIKNGHPKQKALSYTINEMRKVNVKIEPSKLLEITNIYLPK